jgi:hypothetical protein
MAPVWAIMNDPNNDSRPFNDGMVHPKKIYIKDEKKLVFINADGECWLPVADDVGKVGTWVGLYDFDKKTMDTTITEPVFDDDE